jgi:hypothetical protein
MLVLSGLSALALNTTALAQGTASDLGGPITLSGNVIDQMIFNQNLEDDNVVRANIKLTAQISENVKAVLLFRIRQSLMLDGVPADKIEKILSEAYIRIDKVGGKPVAFIIGKQTIPFGNFQTTPPNFENDPIRAANYQRDVIGFTVALEDVGFFDLVEASVFETTALDLEIGDVDGAAIRVTKDIGEKWKVVASTMYKGNGEAKDDVRQSVGFLFKDGNWTVWGEGVHMDGNSTYPDSHWAATAGATYQVNANQRVVVYGSYIADALTRISLAYEVQVTKNVYVTPEMAYVIKADGTGEWQAIFRTEFRFSTK